MKNLTLNVLAAIFAGVISAHATIPEASLNPQNEFYQESKLTIPNNDVSQFSIPIVTARMDNVGQFDCACAGGNLAVAIGAGALGGALSGMSGGAIGGGAAAIGNEIHGGIHDGSIERGIDNFGARQSNQARARMQQNIDAASGVGSKSQD